MAGAEKRCRGKSHLESDSTKTTTRRSEQKTETRLDSCFLSLPAELRNNIYRLCLGTSRVLAIKDMHPDEFQARKEQGRCPWRSAYTAPDHCRGMCETWPPSLCDIGCSFKSPRMRFELTTYTLSNAAALENTTIGLLAVNHQVRQEAGSLFYGANTFNFGTMSSLVPFLRDRPPDTRIYINSLQLELHIYEFNWYPSFAEHGISEAWKRAFTALKKVPHFSLKKLRIKIDDRECHFYREGLKTHTPQMRWLHRLAEISTLDSLGVRYLVQNLGDPGPWHRGPGIPIDGRNTEQELWEFLAPKMLTRMEGESHDAESLKHRRITLLGCGVTSFGNWNDAIVDSD